MINNLLNSGNFIFNGNFYKNHITVFGIDIYYYAICIVLGMVVCCLLAVPLFKRKGENPDFILDLMICIVPSCIVGARLWYVIFDIKTFMNAENPFLAMINIRDGGLAIYGGLAAGAIAVAILCKVRKTSVLKIFDLAVCVVPFGQMMGRWGNFFNQEVYGQAITNPSAQFFPFAVEIGAPGKWYQALFFYEGFLNFFLFVFLYVFLWKCRSKNHGYATGFYFIGYGLIRAVLETFRQSEYNLPLFGKNTSIPAMTIVSCLLILAGVELVLDVMRRDGLIFKKHAKKAATASETEEGSRVNVDTIEREIVSRVLSVENEVAERPLEEGNDEEKE